MQLRGGRMFLDVQKLGYFLMRFFLEHIEVEHRAATIWKLGHELHQHFFRKAASALHHRLFIRHVRQLLLTHHQMRETLLAAQIIYRLTHHHLCHPRGQRTFAPKSEMREYLHKTIVQDIVSLIFIARITVAHRQHTPGKLRVQRLTGVILSRPAAFYQFYLVFQSYVFNTGTSSRRFYSLDAATHEMLQSKTQKEVKKGIKTQSKHRKKADNAELYPKNISAKSASPRRYIYNSASLEAHIQAFY